MSESPLIDYYARRAAEYERIYEKPERQADLAKLREFVARTFAGRRVLEIACGTGYWTEILRRSAATVTAIDINEEVLAIARSKPGNSGVRFQLADAYALTQKLHTEHETGTDCSRRREEADLHQRRRHPPPHVGGYAGYEISGLSAIEGAFDAVLSVFWWSHVPRRELAAFLKQCHAALEPGAIVVFIDNAYVEGSSTPITRTDSDGNTYQTRSLANGSVFEVLKNFPTADELRAAVSPVAATVTVETLDYYWVLKYQLGAHGLNTNAEVVLPSERGSPDPQRVDQVDAIQKLPTPSLSQRAAARESRAPGALSPPDFRWNRA